MNCCYKCDDRTSDCHTYCEKYKKFKTERDAELKVENKSRYKDSQMYSYQRHKYRRLGK